MSSPEVYDFNPNNFPDRILRALGLIAANSAQTEYVIETCIAGCLGVDNEYGAAVTTHMNAPLRDHVLRSLAEIKIDDLDLLDELDSLMDEVAKAFKKRNEFLHQSICLQTETDTCFIVETSARGSVQLTYRKICAEEIETAAADLYEIGMNLMAFALKADLTPLATPERNRFHKLKAQRKKRRKARSASPQTTDRPSGGEDV